MSMFLENLTDFIQQSISSGNFWQANFWGILGSITGVVGFIVSWRSFRYNTPKIEVESAVLITPHSTLISRCKSESLDQLKNQYLPFELEISVRNRRGGPGSIDKPILIIKVPFQNQWFNRFKKIEVKPITQHMESERINENTSSHWTVRHGRAFNVAGGEKVDDRLEYWMKGAENVHLTATNFEKLKYYIQYRDNRGRLHTDRIKKTFEKEL